MTEPDVAAIEARVAAATPGPWRWAFPGSDSPELVGIKGDENYSYESGVLAAEHHGECGCRSACQLTLSVEAADADLIAHAPADLRALLDALAVANRRLAAVEALCDDVEDEYATTCCNRGPSQPCTEECRRAAYVLDRIRAALAGEQ